MVRISAVPLDAKFSGIRRGGPSFPLRVRLLRLLWNVCWLLFASWTPAPLRFVRRGLLQLFGARLGDRADVRGSARVWYPPHLVMGERAILAERVRCYNQAPVMVQPDAIVSQGAFLCCGTHDIDDPNFQLIARPIEIGRNSWVAAEAFVGPGVVVGDGAVLGARAVTTKSLEPWGVYAGNPARLVRRRKVAEPVAEALDVSGAGVANPAQSGRT